MTVRNVCGGDVSQVGLSREGSLSEMVFELVSDWGTMRNKDKQEEGRRGKGRGRGRRGGSQESKSGEKSVQWEERARVNSQLEDRAWDGGKSDRGREVDDVVQGCGDYVIFKGLLKGWVLDFIL